jgi:hypothetical protein
MGKFVQNGMSGKVFDPPPSPMHILALLLASLC